MIIYNQVFDLYHSIYRMLLFLNTIDEGVIIETERLRIWDFYLLFPNKIHEIRLKRDENEIKKLRNNCIKNSDNPYEKIVENRKIFEKLKPYQLSAINCIASYGIIDKEMLFDNRIRIVNRSLIDRFMDKIGEIDQSERNVINLLVSYYSNISLYGTDGLKNKTNLMESKYDAQ